eukprot:6201920-Pleurochrysis_carterae.AAC.1
MRLITHEWSVNDKLLRKRARNTLIPMQSIWTCQRQAYRQRASSRNAGGQLQKCASVPAYQIIGGRRPVGQVDDREVARSHS